MVGARGGDGAAAVLAYHVVAWLAWRRIVRVTSHCVRQLDRVGSRHGCSFSDLNGVCPGLHPDTDGDLVGSAFGFTARCAGVECTARGCLAFSTETLIVLRAMGQLEKAGQHAVADARADGRTAARTREFPYERPLQIGRAECGTRGQQLLEFEPDDTLIHRDHGRLCERTPGQGFARASLRGRARRRPRLPAVAAADSGKGGQQQKSEPSAFHAAIVRDECLQR